MVVASHAELISFGHLSGEEALEDGAPPEGEVGEVRPDEVVNEVSELVLVDDGADGLQS